MAVTEFVGHFNDWWALIYDNFLIIYTHNLLITLLFETRVRFSLYKYNEVKEDWLKEISNSHLENEWQKCTRWNELN